MFVKILVCISLLVLCLPVHAGGLTALLSEQLGITEEQAAGGAGALLDMAKSQVDGADFSKLAESVPETADLLAAAPKLEVDDSPAAESLLDGGSGAQLKSALGLVSSFDKLGLDASTLKSFTPIVVDYFRNKGGEAAGNMLMGALSGGDKAGSGVLSLASAAPLLGLLSGDLGVGKEQAAGGAGALLRAAKTQLGGDDFSKISGAVPGIQALIGMEPKPEESSTSDLLGMAGSLFGDDSGVGQQVVGVLGLADSFDKFGLDAGMLDRFIPIIIDWVKTEGGEMVSNLLADGFSGGNSEDDSSDTDGTEGEN